MLFYTKGYFIILYFFAFTCAISVKNINVSDNNLDQLQKLYYINLREKIFVQIWSFFIYFFYLN